MRTLGTPVALSILLLMCPLAGAGEPAGATSVSAALLPASKLTLFGDSTVRKFSSQATVIKISGKLETDAAAPGAALNLKLDGVSMVIPIQGLKSDNSTLDEHLADALKAGKFPEIRAAIKSYEVTGKGPDSAFKVTAAVDLSLAGTTRTIAVDAAVSRDGDAVRIQGEKQLLMTDFDIVPPTLMLGVIRTSNEILIRFDLLIAAAQGAARLSQSPRPTDNKGEK